MSHLVAGLAFAALGIALALRRQPSLFAGAVAVAAFATAAWAFAWVAAGRYGPESLHWLSKLETLRTAAWIAVLLLLQRRSLGLDQRASSTFAVALAIGFVVALQLALDMLFAFGADPFSVQAPVAMLFVTLRLVMAISGLVLLHNLYVNSDKAGGVSFRLFAVGLGLIFAYDLNLYTLHFLLGEPNPGLLNVRGAVNALAVPLFFLACRQDGGHRLHLSRQAAFHTVSFSIIGAYLIVMALLAHGLRLTGGDWGELLQVMFLAATLIAGALVILSPRFRAELKVRISRNFYRYRYDYRVEWLRFIETIDAAPRPGGEQTPFRERLIEAVANVLDSPGGALLEPADGGGFAETARWRWPSLDAPRISEGAAITLFLAETSRVVEFDRLRAPSDRDADSRAPLMLPDWAAADRTIWLAVPLVLRERLTGVLLLHRSLAPRDLNWEDHALLGTLGRQGASYLAEAETQARLDEARSFDEFNRRFAFVMHDLKNVVSQLALVARNAERHADKPAFRADMLATLNASVTKMTDLLKLMGREAEDRAEPSPEGEVDLARLIAIVAAGLRRQHDAILLDGVETPVRVAGDAGRLEAMLTHLVQNAIEASAPDAPVSLSLTAAGGEARIRLADRGHGMSATFVRDELFRPFRSTKTGGFGIGAFEAREIVRAHGGRLEVESRPGEGSCFTIVLPLAERQSTSVAA